MGREVPRRCGRSSPRTRHRAVRPAVRLIPARQEGRFRASGSQQKGDVMSRGSWREGVCAIVCGVVVTESAWGQRTIFVATCGNDTWTGLNAACAGPDGPKRTLAAGLGAAFNGDTVLVADGTYVADGLVVVDRSVTLRSSGGAGGWV